METLIITLGACAPIIPLWRRMAYSFAFCFQRTYKKWNSSEYNYKVYYTENLSQINTENKIWAIILSFFCAIPWPISGILYFSTQSTNGHKFFVPPKSVRKENKLREVEKSNEELQKRIQQLEKQNGVGN